MHFLSAQSLLRCRASQLWSGGCDSAMAVALARCGHASRLGIWMLARGRRVTCDDLCGGLCARAWPSHVGRSCRLLLAVCGVPHVCHRRRGCFIRGLALVLHWTTIASLGGGRGRGVVASLFSSSRTIVLFQSRMRLSWRPGIRNCNSQSIEDSFRSCPVEETPSDIRNSSDVGSGGGRRTRGNHRANAK